MSTIGLGSLWVNRKMIDFERATRRLSWSVWLAAVLISCFARLSNAEVIVNGTREAARVGTSGEDVSEVIAAVAKFFNLEYASRVPLDAPARHTYRGSLDQVIFNLLEGYNYISKTDGVRVEINVISKRKEFADAPSRVEPTRKGVTSRWRE